MGHSIARLLTLKNPEFGFSVFHSFLCFLMSSTEVRVVKLRQNMRGTQAHISQPRTLAMSTQLFVYMYVYV